MLAAALFMFTMRKIRVTGTYFEVDGLDVALDLRSSRKQSY